MTAKKRSRSKQGGAVDGRGWRIAMLVLCTVGACLSVDLLRLHVNVHTDPDYHSYCAMSQRVNCDTVAASDYAVFLELPLSLWGLLGYLGMGALTIWGLRGSRYGRAWPLGLAFGIAAFFSVLSVGLFLVSHLVVESVCVVCAGTYAVNFGLAYVAYMALRRDGSGIAASLRGDLREVASAPRSFTGFVGTVAVLVVALWFLVPSYWHIEASTGPGGLPVGVTPAGHPWIGAPEPVLEIEEYSDYQCPHCRRGHDDVRRLIEQHAGRIRLVHRHFPLDQACNEALKRPFHPHACRYALLSVCAQEQGLFWEANDYLFAHGRRRAAVTAEELAADLALDADDLRACVAGARAQRVVQQDLQSGRALHMRGTPTFVVNGDLYPGRLPPEVVAAALE